MLSIYVPYSEDERQMALAEQFRQATEMAQIATRLNAEALAEFEISLNFADAQVRDS
jgi:hypothetical protein